MKNGETLVRKLSKLRDRLKKHHIGEIGTGITKRWIFTPKDEAQAANIDALMGDNLAIELPDRGVCMRPEAPTLPLHQRLQLLEKRAIDTLDASERYKTRLAEIAESEKSAKAKSEQTSKKDIIQMCDAFGFTPYADPEWYALRVLALCRWIFACLDKDSVPKEEIASDAMALAALNSEWETKARWETRAMRSEKAGATQKRYAAAWKGKAVEIANKRWNGSRPAPTLGKVVAEIAAQAHRNKRTVRDWLIEASSIGLIDIPPEARKPGRPKKTTQA